MNHNAYETVLELNTKISQIRSKWHGSPEQAKNKKVSRYQAQFYCIQEQLHLHNLKHLV